MRFCWEVGVQAIHFCWGSISFCSVYHTNRISPYGSYLLNQKSYRPFSYCIDRAIRPGWAHSQRRVGVNITIPLHWPSCDFDSPNFPSFCSLSAIISFQTCSNKCILYVLSFFFFFFFFLFLILPGCSFKCYHLFSHEAQGRNVPNSLTVGMGFHCSYVPSGT